MICTGGGEKRMGCWDEIIACHDKIIEMIRSEEVEALRVDQRLNWIYFSD